VTKKSVRGKLAKSEEYKELLIYCDAAIVFGPLDDNEAKQAE